MYHKLKHPLRTYGSFGRHVNHFVRCLCLGSCPTVMLVSFFFPYIASEHINVGQAPGTKYEQFPEKYSLWFYVNSQPLYLDLVRDDDVTSVMSPALFKLSPYLPSDVMNDDNQQVKSISNTGYMLCRRYHQHQYHHQHALFSCPATADSVGAWMLNYCFS